MKISSTGHMQLKVIQENNLATLYLGGSFEFADHHVFQKSCLRLLKKPKINILEIDLSKINHIDSAALGMLLLLREHTRDSGKAIRLINPSTFVSQVFDLTNFELMFEVN